MPIRGVRNPVPKTKPPTNSGMFSGKGQQKMDPVKRPAKVQAAFEEAHRNTNYKYGEK